MCLYVHIHTYMCGNAAPTYTHINTNVDANLRCMNMKSVSCIELAFLFQLLEAARCVSLDYLILHV